MKTLCKGLIVLSIIFLSSTELYSQNFSYFSSFNKPYFGLNLPGKTPIKFEIKGYFQFFNNGTECYFESNGIWYSKLENGKWNLPVKTNIDYGKYADFEMNPSPNGEWLLFNSVDRKLPIGTTYPEDVPIWISKRKGSVWTEPFFSGIGGMYPTCTDNGTIYFTFDAAKKICHIAKAKPINGKYEEIEILPEPIYSKLFSDAHPYISSDESFLIFDSDGRKMENGCSLFISYRKRDGTFTEPINMGEYINNEGGAALAYVTPDRKYIFYRTNSGIIFWISGTIIGELKPKNLK